MTPATAGTHDVTAYGAGGESTDTDAFREALSVCEESGGTVFVPPGEYTTAPLVVGDDTTIRVASGATVRFVADYASFPTVESRWEGWNQHGFHPCLWIRDAANVRIEGGGRIDGGGSYWWDLKSTGEWPAGLEDRVAEMDELNDKSDDVSSFTLRPPLLQVYDSTNVTVEGVTLSNSPFWNTHVVYSTDVTISDVRIENPADAPNGDGIDVDSSRFVRVSDCYINAGDDAICLKSGKDAEGRRVDEPCEAIAVTDCTVEAGHGGVVIGSEMSGDVRDVVVSNCVFRGTDRGIRIKTQRGRGGVVEDLRFDTIVMRGVVCPFVINGYYFTDVEADPEPVDQGTPAVRNVTFQHITARDVASAGFLAGLPERRFGPVAFEDVDVEATRSFDAADTGPSMAYNYDPSHGFWGKSLGDVAFRDVRVRTRSGPAFAFADTDGLRIEGLDVADDGDLPAVRTEDVEVLAVDTVPGSNPGKPLLRVRGEATRSVNVGGGLGSAAITLDGPGDDVLSID